MTATWRVSRIQYSACLGFLVAIGPKLTSPIGGLFGYALAALVTALRFQTLERKPWPAFVPLAMIAAALMLSIAPGAQSASAALLSKDLHAFALLIQVGISVRAALSQAPTDPISRKGALARDLLAKRRQLLRTLKEAKPLQEARRREVAKLLAINAQRQAYIAAHGLGRTEEYQELIAQFEAQQKVIDPLAARSDAVAERTMAQVDELKRARQAWADRNKSKAA
jgi:hypothetical protein